MKKQSFWNKNEQDRTINKELITKKNFDEQKNLILYQSTTSLLMGVRLSYLVLLYLQTTTLWEKYKESIKKVKN